MDEWMAAANAAANKPNAPWADRYAPETLRLAALVHEVERLQVRGTLTGPDALPQASKALSLARESERLSGAAATLLLLVRAHFPTAAGYARADQAKYRLWGWPYEPETAVDLYRQAMTELPGNDSSDQGTAFQAHLTTFLLAAGHEDQARQHLKRLYPADTAQALDLRVAAYLQELGQWFIDAPPLARPARFEALATRWVEIEPASPYSRVLAARLALEQQNDAAAMAHIEEIRTHSRSAEFAQTARFLVGQFPESEALQFMIRRMFGSRTGQTRPAGEATSQPADGAEPQLDDNSDE
jgi:hypothetical protein